VEGAMAIQMKTLIVLGVLLTARDFGHSSITKIMLIINDN